MRCKINKLLNEGQQSVRSFKQRDCDVKLSLPLSSIFQNFLILEPISTKVSMTNCDKGWRKYQKVFDFFAPVQRLGSENGGFNLIEIETLPQIGFYKSGQSFF